MDNTNLKTLDFLIKFKKEKKKKEPAKMERTTFHDAWLALAKEEGYSAAVERYLYEGAIFCTASPLKDYIVGSNDPYNIISAFFNGSMYQKDCATTFRLVSNLLALLLSDKDHNTLCAPIIKRFPAATLTKEHKQSGTATTTFVKYFLGALDPQTPLIPLSHLNLKSVFISDFCVAVHGMLGAISVETLSPAKLKNLKRIQMWLKEYEDELSYSDPNVKPVAQMKKNTETKMHSTSKDTEHVEDAGALPKTARYFDTDAPETFDKKETSESRKTDPAEKLAGMSPDVSAEKPLMPSDPINRLTSLLEQIGKELSYVRQEKKHQDNQVTGLERELDLKQQELSAAEENINKQGHQIATLQAQLRTANDEIMRLTGLIDEKEQLILKQKSEIEERIKLADVISRDKSKQSDEVLQRLASKIKIEYLDFIDAEGLPISCDLGENFRLQLQTVFDILESSGVKIK